MNLYERLVTAIEDKNTILGGAYGIMHLLIGLGVFWGVWFISRDLTFTAIAGSCVVVYYWAKETVRFTNFYRSLDSFLDYVLVTVGYAVSIYLIH